MAPLWILCHDGKLDEVRSSLACGEDVDDKSPNGITALMFAVRNPKNKRGETALMRAVDQRHNSIVELLLDQPGVKTNEKDTNGWTALHYAVVYNNPEGARMLLLHPTMDSANAKDNDGDTAVMTAVIRGHKEVLSELVAHQSVSLDIGNVVGSGR